MTEKHPATHEQDPIVQLGDYLDAATHPDNNTDPGTRNFLVDVAGRITSREEGNAGQSWGGVEIPDTRKTVYELTIHHVDGTTSPVEVPADIATRLQDYAADQQAKAAEQGVKTPSPESSSDEQAEKLIGELAGIMVKMRSGTATEDEKKQFLDGSKQIKIVRDPNTRKAIRYDLSVGTPDKPETVGIGKHDQSFPTIAKIKHEVWRHHNPEKAKEEDEAAARRAAAPKLTPPTYGGIVDNETPPAPEPVPAIVPAPPAVTTKLVTAPKKGLNLENPDDAGFQELVVLDKGGRPRHAKGNGKWSGKPMTYHRAELIEEHKDLILGGLGERQTEIEIHEAELAAQAAAAAARARVPAGKPKKFKREPRTFEQMLALTGTPGYKLKNINDTSAEANDATAEAPKLARFRKVARSIGQLFVAVDNAPKKPGSVSAELRARLDAQTARNSAHEERLAAIIARLEKNKTLELQDRIDRFRENKVEKSDSASDTNSSETKTPRFAWTRRGRQAKKSKAEAKSSELRERANQILNRTNRVRPKASR